MSGWELIEQARHLKPDLAVLVTSGYEIDAPEFLGAGGPGTPYLQKPFEVRALAAAVRAAIEPRR